MDVIGMIQKIVLEGKHGPYAVTSVEGIEGSVTFSLQPSVWHEKNHPELGTRVVLGDLRMKRAGWKALSARYVTPHDKQSASSTEQGKNL